MTRLISETASILSAVGFAIRLDEDGELQYLVFEDDTTLGFVFAYDKPPSLLSRWQADANRAIERQRLALRRGAQKAWNLYLVLLAEAPCVEFESVQLSVIEEDLSGTRKIARAGLANTTALKDALLPLLPLQAAPRLEAVNSVEEITKRTTAIDPQVVTAFLRNADPSVLLTMMEGAQ
jgi:hypothetical protein